MMRGGVYFWGIVQFIAAVAVGTMPIWVAEFLSENSRYRYLFGFEPIALCFIGVAIAIILAPQLLRIVQIVFRNLAALSFQGIYATRRRNYLPLALSILCAAALALGVANLAQGVSALGYSLMREVKHAQDINRQHLVMEANAAERAEGIGGSLKTLKRIVALYPDDRRNTEIEDHLERLENAQELSAQVAASAVQYRAGGNLIMAAESFRAALQIWPHNRAAETELSELQEGASAASASVGLLYDGCLNLDSPGEAVIAAAAPYVLREPRAVLLHLGGGGQHAGAASHIACEEAREAEDRVAFTDAALERFSTELHEDDSGDEEEF